ncbi:MAG: tetratricopeptide repeat protein [Myxococcales bacterium]
MVWRWLRLPLVLLAVTLATLPALHNEFVWDDLALIVESDFIYDPANLGHVFGVDTMFAADGGKFQAQAQLDTYRPVTIATFFLDASMAGKEPFFFHLNNMLAHLICVALVYFLALRLLPETRRTAAVWAALWFGLHPLLGEAHVWINGRSDLWCTLFGLSGILVWLRARGTSPGGRSALLHGVSALLFLLGLLSKETLLPALAVFWLWDLGVFVRPLKELERSRTVLLRTLAIWLPVGLYLALRGRALQGMHVSAGGTQLGLALERLPVLILDGLVSALAPTMVMPRYLAEEYARLSPPQLFACAAALAAFGALVWLRRQHWPLGAFAATWFTAVLGPACLIATLQWYGFNRYLYLPLTLLSIALADALGFAFEGLRARTSPTVVRMCQVSVGLYLLMFGVRLLDSVNHWNGSIPFYSQIIAEQPQASHGYGGLGKLLVEQGRPDLALEPLQRAVELNAGDSRYLNNLGIAYLRLGRGKDAFAIAKRGQRLFPDLPKFVRLEQQASQL